MGGIIEDWIFEELGRDKLTTSEVGKRLQDRFHPRKYGTIGRHLRKMYRIKRLERERVDGRYFYWNPAMLGRES